MKISQASASFLKERSKKLLSIRGWDTFNREAIGEVFLLLFFQKKKRFPLAAGPFA